MSRRFLGGLFRTRSRGSDLGAQEGSSRRGRHQGGDESYRSTRSARDWSTRDSSTHSALFDLELSHRGGAGGGGAAASLDLAARLHDDSEATRAADGSVHFPGGLLQRVIYLGRPLMEFELGLLQDVNALRELCVGAEGLQLERLAEELHYLGYVVELRQNNPTDPAYKHSVDKACLEKLRHSYVVCYGRRDGSVQHVCIVDPRFRDQFQIGHSTTSYSQLLKAVPPEFVGSPLRLQALVNVLCSEIAGVYAAQDLPLPPWRKVNAVLSKWFSPADMAAGEAMGSALSQAAARLAGLPPGDPAPPLPEPPPAPAVPAAAPGGLPGWAERQPSPQQLGITAGQAVPAKLQHAQQLQHEQQQQQQVAARAGMQLPAGGVPQAGQQSSQVMHFFEALQLHQASLRRQQEDEQRQREGPLVAQQQQQQQQGGGLAAAAAAAGGLGPEPPDARLHDRTNRPRRRQRDSQQQWQRQAAAQHAVVHQAAAQLAQELAAQQAQQAQQQQGVGSLWAAQAEGSSAEPPAAPDQAAQGPSAQASQPGNSWTNLSTILETRSAQSSPHSVGAAAAGSRASRGASRASSESGRAVPGGGPYCPTMPVAAFAGEAAALPHGPVGGGGGPPLPLGGAAAVGPPPGGKKNGKRVVSLLAKGLKSMGQRQTWVGLLPNVGTARRVGSGEEGSFRDSGDRSGRGSERSWRGPPGGGGGAAGGEGSKHGRLRPPVAPHQYAR